MKKLLLIGTAAMLVSGSVFATQARLLALGMKETDNEGMYHISDARNIFLNPAYVNSYSNEVVAEWGSRGFNASAAGTASNATIYRTNSPKAQGGVFHKVGDLVFGVYFGNESNTSSLLRIAGTSQAATLNGAGGQPTASKMLQTADNVLDVFVGGDAGVKWGVNGSYSSGKNETNSSKDSSGAVRMGVMTDGWDAHLNVSVNSKSESTDVVAPLGSGALTETVNQKFEGKLGVQLGGSYVVTGNNRIFGYVKHYGWEQSDSYSKYTALAGATANTSAATNGQQGTVKGDFTSYHLGWGSHTDVNATDKVYYSVAGRKTDINLKFNTKGEVRHIVIPLTVAYEAVANEWLTLRGSIIQNLWSQRDNKGMGSLNVVGRSLITGLYGANGKATLANSTEVNAGATLTYGQLSVDGLIGMTAPARNGTVQEKNQGVLALDNLSTSVAMTYKF